MADKLVKATSEAYGYNYASLSDIVKQGNAIPKMRVKPIDGQDYVEYFDGTEWQTGAKVVIPELKGSNEAQRYGSALTYARRYTALMALALVSDDDKTVEKTGESSTERTKQKRKFNLEDADKAIANAKTADEVRKIYASVPAKLRQYVESSCKRKIEELA